MPCSFRSSSHTALLSVFLFSFLGSQECSWRPFRSYIPTISHTCKKSHFVNQKLRQALVLSMQHRSHSSPSRFLFVLPPSLHSQIGSLRSIQPLSVITAFSFIPLAPHFGQPFRRATWLSLRISQRWLKAVFPVYPSHINLHFQILNICLRLM